MTLFEQLTTAPKDMNDMIDMVTRAVKDTNGKKARKRVLLILQEKKSREKSVEINTVLHLLYRNKMEVLQYNPWCYSFYHHLFV